MCVYIYIFPHTRLPFEYTKRVHGRGVFALSINFVGDCGSYGAPTSPQAPETTAADCRAASWLTLTAADFVLQHDPKPTATDCRAAAGLKPTATDCRAAAGLKTTATDCRAAAGLKTTATDCRAAAGMELVAVQCPVRSMLGRLIAANEHRRYTFLD